MTENATEKLDELIGSFDTAMLVSRSLEGKPRARPMAIAAHSEGGARYFATRAEDEKLEEILEDPDVAVTVQGGGRYLSISGQARLLTDKSLADALWSESMRLWFPEGRGVPQLTVILVDPCYAEYRDRTGLRRLEVLWEAGKALLTGDMAEDEDLAGHDRVKLQQPVRNLRRRETAARTPPAQRFIQSGRKR